jgi:hypothetical protein
MVSVPPIASSVFHLTSPIYSRVEEGSANTPAPGTNRSNFDKGSDTKLSIEYLLVEYQREHKSSTTEIRGGFHGLL